MTSTTRMYENCIKPVLQLASRTEMMDAFTAHWPNFNDHWNGLVSLSRVIQHPEWDAEKEKQNLDEVLESIAAAVAGEDAAHEVQFCLRTYRRASALAERIVPLDEAHDDLLGRDRDLAFRFSNTTTVFWWAVLAVPALEERPSTVAFDFVFELLRHGAMNAYAIARQAYELRAANAPAVTLDANTEEMVLAHDDAESDIDEAEFFDEAAVG